MTPILLALRFLCALAQADGGEGPPQCKPTSISGDGINMVIYDCPPTNVGGSSGGGRYEPPPTKAPEHQPPVHNYAAEQNSIYKRINESQAAFQAQQDAARAANAKEAADFQQRLDTSMKESTARLVDQSRRLSTEMQARARADAELTMAVAHAMVRRTQAISASYEARRQAIKTKSETTTKSTDEAIQKTQDAMTAMSKNLMGALGGLEGPSPQLASADNVPFDQVANDIQRMALAEGERAGVEGDTEGQSAFAKVATMAADIGLGFIPVVGTGRDGYEAISGRSLLTGQRLGVAGRTFAALGALTGGLVSGGSKGIKALAKLTKGMGTAAENGNEARVAFNLAEEISQSTRTIERFNAFKEGPLLEIKVGKVPVSSTFHAESYAMNELTKNTKLYRVHNGSGDGVGKFWSRVKPEGRFQATYDSALAPQFGNRANAWVEITVPAGKIIYEGKAASVSIPGGELMGHGSQVYINELIPKTWITGGGEF